jgi:uncharacterized membrane protein YhaH (DUF805 family)
MKHYFSFLGKATRSEFWAVNLIVIFTGWLFLLAALAFSGLVTIANPVVGGLFAASSIATWFVGSLWLILSVGVRRCRDADISVFWVIPALLPILFVVMTIVLGVLPTVDKSHIPEKNNE